MSDIAHIACMPGQADLFATAEFENNVCVWSLRTRERLAALSTVLDFGGRRLCLRISAIAITRFGAWRSPVSRHGDHLFCLIAMRRFV